MIFNIRIRYYTIVAFIIGVAQYADAQNSIQIIPSASQSNGTLLSDYYSGRQEGLSVLLRNVDTNQPFLQGYLRITIEGQGVKLQTGSYAILPPIDLMEGNTVNIGPSELAVYFKPQYLQGSTGFGINQPNVFPEGFYQFCFEVLEKNTNRLIGSMQCVDANLSFSEAPDLVLPEQGKTIFFSNPFTLVFRWKPQQLNVQNSEYIFSLVELESDAKVTESSFAKARQVYSVKLKEEKLIYGEEEPLLQKGKKYAWRVQVNAATATLEKEPIKDDGYSEINWFLLK